MSTQSEIARISNATEGIKSAIADKGVTVPAGTKIDGLEALVRAIPQGGGTPTLQNKTVVSNGVVTADSGYDGLGTVNVAIPVYAGTVEELTMIE